jgi:hypothetical protein
MIAAGVVAENELSHKAEHNHRVPVDGFQVMWESLHNINRSYYLCQVTWHLHSILVILAQLIMAGFM